MPLKIVTKVSIHTSAVYFESCACDLSVQGLLSTQDSQKCHERFIKIRLDCSFEKSYVSMSFPKQSIS